MTLIQTFRQRLDKLKSYDFAGNQFLMRLYHARIYLFACLLPAVLMFLVYAAFQVYPFGDNSVLVLDLNGQYIYYYEAYWDAFRGDGSLFYSWSRILGGEMAGTFAYYLASPFMLILLLFPRNMIVTATLLMQLAKIGVMGGTFAFFIRRTRKVDNTTTLIFSLLYALMSYSVVQLMDPMWLDGLIYLPLICWGVEQLCDKDKILAVSIPLCLMLLAHYYIGWMICIFTVLYFIYYLFFIKRDIESFRQVFGIGFRFFAAALLAGAGAAVVLLPTWQSLQLGKLEFTQPDFSMRTQFVLADFFTKLLPESYDTVRNESLPMVYCGILTLFMTPLFFLNHNIPTRKKLGSVCILTVLLISMYIAPVDIAWHGFQVPNWLPYRYSFLFSFVLLTIGAEAFQRMEGWSPRQLAAVMAGLLLYVLYVDTRAMYWLETQKAIWFSMICIIAVGVLLYCCKRYSNMQGMSLFLLVLICGELFGSSLETLKSIDKDVAYSKYSSYIPVIPKEREMVQTLYEQDPGFYRMEKTWYRTVNDPMATGMRGLTHSSSALNARPIALLDKLGYVSRGHYTKYKGDTMLTDALFGIKYVATKDKPVAYDQQPAALTYDETRVYENPYALSIGFMANNSILDVELSKDNPFVNQNQILSAMFSNAYQEYFRPILIDETLYENVDASPYNDHTLYKPVVEGQNAHIEYLLTAPTDDMIYMYLPNNLTEKTLNIWLNHEYLDQYYTTDFYTIKTLGRFDPQASLSVIATLTEDYAFMRDQWFFYLDEELFSSAIEQLQARQWNITSYSDTHLEGTVVAEDHQILFTTIPYEEGWTVRVDGKRVEPEMVLDSLLGVRLTPGEHVVEMDFVPGGFRTGVLLSITGIGLMIIVGFVQRRRERLLLRRLYF